MSTDAAADRQKAEDVKKAKEATEKPALERKQKRQEILNSLGPDAGPMRRVVGHIFSYSKKDRKKIKDLVEKLEAIQ